MNIIPIKLQPRSHGLRRTLINVYPKRALSLIKFQFHIASPLSFPPIFSMPTPQSFFLPRKHHGYPWQIITALKYIYIYSKPRHTDIRGYLTEIDGRRLFYGCHCNCIVLVKSRISPSSYKSHFEGCEREHPSHVQIYANQVKHCWCYLLYAASQI